MQEKESRMHIALINVVMDGDYQYEQEVPLGVCSIAAFLRVHGHEVTIHLCFASRGEAQVEAAAAVRADEYGFQLTMVNFAAVRGVAIRLRQAHPPARIIAGGPFLSMLYQEILSNEPSLDAIVIGEGEFTTLEYLAALEQGTQDFSAIQGLVWRDAQGDIVVNPVRRPTEDLDALPFPTRDFLDQAQVDPVDGGLRESVRVITSRGCIGKCSFCCVNLFSKMFKGRRWRGRSPKHVVDELELLVRTYNAKLFNFSDSSFEDPGALGKRRAGEICREILRRDLQISAKVYMRCETMKTEADRDLLRLYKQAGIDVIIIGAEAGSDFELDIYEKHASVEDNYRTALMLKEMDLFYVLVGFIMFGPYSTAQTLRHNIEFLHSCGLACSVRSLTNVLMLVKASKLYHRLKAEGKVLEPQHYWNQPTYVIEDPVGRRVSLLWENVFARYPHVREMDSLQINIGNIISRMTNPLNRQVLDAFPSEFAAFKQEFRRMEQNLGDRNYRHFHAVLQGVQNNLPDRDLQAMFHDCFVVEYADIQAQYEALYSGFLGQISDAGFGLSGLVFKNFTSALSVDDTKNVAAV